MRNGPEPDLAAHARSFPALQHLDVSACRRVCGGDLRGLAAMRALRSIVLSGCEDVGDEGLAHLGALAGLTSLNLANCCKARAFHSCAFGTGAFQA